MVLTDAVLQARWSQKRDAEAFRELVNRYASMVFATSRRILRNAADAEEVTQDCFLKLCQLRQPAENLAAWLHRTATNKSIDVLRSQSRRHEAEKRWESPAEGVADLDWADVEPFVDEAIESLPETLRTSLVRYYLRSHTQREIAESLGVHQSTVSDRVRQGVERVRRHLERRGLGVTMAVLGVGLSERTASAAPSSLLGRLGKLAVLGRGADRVTDSSRTSASSSTSGPGRFTNSGGLMMKITVASILGLAIVGGVVFYTLQLPSSTESPVDELVQSPPETPDNNAANSPGDASTASAAGEEATASEESTPDEPAPKTASVSGRILDANGKPLPEVEVYLAITTPIDEDFIGQLGAYYRDDYFRRDRFHATQTDEKGRFAFTGIADIGEARIGAFLEGHAGPWAQGSTAQKSIAIAEGSLEEDVDLILRAGQTLKGRVRTVGGDPVTDAVLTVTTAWTTSNHIFWPTGLAATDEEGRFRIGLEENASGCHLRVNSDTQGQGFTLEVPVGEDAVEVLIDEVARVEGEITWDDGSIGSGLTVRVNGRLPEPPIPVSRMGIRSYVVQDGLVGADGRYVIEGLHPGLNYDIFVIDGSLGEQQARKHPLTPRMVSSFRLKADETKTWDRVVARPITVRGRVRTELTGTLLPEGQVGFWKDGKPLKLMSVWADEDGYFVAHLDKGAGTYRVHAMPPVGFPESDALWELLNARLGKTLELSSGDDVEVDLKLFEPAVVSLRVVDAAGDPVERMHGVLRATIPPASAEGKPGSLGVDTPMVLDAEGRTRLLHYYPATELWYTLSGDRDGPTVETRRFVIEPGVELPEETIRLPETTRLQAKLVDGGGKFLAKESIRVRVTYDDGSVKRFHVRTDDKGSLDLQSKLAAKAFTIQLQRRSSDGTWTSERLDGSRHEELDLGEIVLEEEDE